MTTLVSNGYGCCKQPTMYRPLCTATMPAKKYVTQNITNAEKDLHMQGCVYGCV